MSEKCSSYLFSQLLVSSFCDHYGPNDRQLSNLLVNHIILFFYHIPISLFSKVEIFNCNHRSDNLYLLESTNTHGYWQHKDTHVLPQWGTLFTHQKNHTSYVSKADQGSIYFYFDSVSYDFTTKKASSGLFLIRSPNFGFDPSSKKLYSINARSLYSQVFFNHTNAPFRTQKMCVGHFNYSRSHAFSLAVADNRVYVVGGMLDQQKLISEDCAVRICEMCDLETGVSRRIGDCNVQRSFPALYCCRDDSSAHLVTGGSRAVYGARSAEVYDAHKDRWYLVPSVTNFPYFGCPSSIVCVNRCITIGNGCYEIEHKLGSTEEYDMRDRDQRWRVLSLEGLDRKTAIFGDTEECKEKNVLFRRTWLVV